MCGIVGIIDRQMSEPVARGRLAAMLDLIRHRGPDGDGTFFSTEFGFAAGMRRLSIIDLEGGWQPIWNEDKTVGVVFNGEIYNYIELRDGLRAKGHIFQTNSDTEVLVHAYEEYGPRMFERLRGMFGLAIFDLKNARLVIARDHFGQKPMYYTWRDGKFAFGSELKSLLPLPWVRRDINEDAFLDFVSWMSVPSPSTHLTHVRKLPAASYLLIDLHNPVPVEPKIFWSYDLSDPAELFDMDEAAEKLDAALHDSLRVHLRSDVPIGVLLSSGLDSRVISVYAQDLTAGALQTFSVGFDTEESELEGAAKTAAELKTRHHPLVLTHRDLGDNIDRVAWHLDEPIGDPAAFAVLRICELARNHVRVLLSGEGSDELFGGYVGRYLGMIQTLRRADLLRQSRFLIPPPSEAFPRSRFGRVRKYASRSRGAHAVGLRIEGFPGDIRAPHGLTPLQLQRLNRREEELSRSLYLRQRDDLAELTRLDVKWQLAESLLLKADKMSMAASVELRVPFLDVEIARLASRIDTSLKLSRKGPGKMVLRHTLARKLNEDFNRPKKGFLIPLTTWFRGPLKQQAYDVLFSKSSFASQLDATLLRTAWDAFQKRQAPIANTIYALWLYETWRRQVETHPTVE